MWHCRVTIDIGKLFADDLFESFFRSTLLLSIQCLWTADTLDETFAIQSNGNSPTYVIVNDVGYEGWIRSSH